MTYKTTQKWLSLGGFISFGIVILRAFVACVTTTAPPMDHPLIELQMTPIMTQFQRQSKKSAEIYTGHHGKKPLTIVGIFASKTMRTILFQDMVVLGSMNSLGGTCTLSFW